MIRLVLALGLLPASALACGGFFCNGVVPIQQDAERILFEVDPGGTITATVEVQYSGQPNDFSWIVPVPRGFEAQQVGIGDPALFDALEQATAPTFFVPGIKESWTVTDGGVATEVETWDSVGGFGCSPSTRVRSVEIVYEPGEERTETHQNPDEEIVEATSVSTTNVGPYEATVIAARTGQDLLDWLEGAGYAITDDAAARAEPYVAAGMDFLALRLQPTAPAGALDPIVFKYEGEVPMIPLVLTGVAASDDTEIVVYIAGEEDWRPANFSQINAFDYDEVQVTGWGGTDYGVRLRDRIEDAGGQAFIPEFVGDSGAPDFLGGLPRLTRLRTFLGPDAMTVDPMFEAVGIGADVSNVHELPVDEDEAGFPWWLALLVLGVCRRDR
jgi:hypothetical protein